MIIMENPTKQTNFSWDLPLRLIAAAFLCSVGVGYISALVNLHFQEASPGNPLPGPEDVIRVYHGSEKSSQLLRLLKAPDSLPFNGSGSMAAAFNKKKNPGAIKTGAVEMIAQLGEAGYQVTSPDLKTKMEYFASTWLEIERKSLIAWIEAGFPEINYTNDTYYSPQDIVDQYSKMRSSFVQEVTALKRIDGTPPDKALDPKEICFCDTLQFENGKLTARIKTILEERCVRCHGPGKSVSSYPLSRYEHLRVYLDEDLGAAGGKSLAKLALTTHVHLLAFAVLYGMTGLIFALLPYPAWLRLILAPAPLVLQVMDISFWWLARLDAPLGPLFAKAIMATGGLVALSLVSQIVLGLWGLFPGKARYLVIATLVFGGLVGLGAKALVIDPYLATEVANPPATIP